MGDTQKFIDAVDDDRYASAVMAAARLGFAVHRRVTFILVRNGAEVHTDLSLDDLERQVGIL